MSKTIGKYCAAIGLSLALCAVLVTGIKAASVAQEYQDKGHEQLVFSSPLKTTGRSQLTAVLVSYAPGGKSPSHSHAGAVFAYVISGSIRSENSSTGPARVYRSGESFFEPEGSVHRVSENASDSESAELLAVFVAPPGSRLTLPQD